MKTIIGVVVVAALVLFGSAQPAFPDVITVPSAVGEGEWYRLAFVTSGRYTAEATTIAPYNTIVDNIGDAVIASDWTMIGSTTDTDANANTLTRPGIDPDYPIYLLNDTKLADSNSDLWDGSIDRNFNVDETGTAMSSAGVWTGSTTAGVESVGNALGDDHPLAGRTSTTGVQWVYYTSNYLKGSQRQLYAISGPLQNQVVPEPSSLVLAISFGGAWLTASLWRRKRKKTQP